MTLRPILAWPDPRLSLVCEPVTDFGADLQTLVQDMFDTMYAAAGRGLAGPQIGEMVRVFVTDVTWKDEPATPVTMINPKLVWQSDEVLTVTEGCLSIEGITTDIERPAEIEIQWFTPEGLEMSAQLSGIAARCALHELDHLNGIVTLDRLSAEDRLIAEQQYEAVDD